MAGMTCSCACCAARQRSPNQLVAVAACWTDKNGLDKALGPNGISKLGKPFLVKAAPRLPGPTLIHSTGISPRPESCDCGASPIRKWLPEGAQPAGRPFRRRRQRQHHPGRQAGRGHALAVDAGAFSQLSLAASAAGFFFAVSAFFAMLVIPAYLSLCLSRVDVPLGRAAFASRRSTSCKRRVSLRSGTFQIIDQHRLPERRCLDICTLRGTTVL